MKKITAAEIRPEVRRGRGYLRPRRLGIGPPAQPPAQARQCRFPELDGVRASIRKPTVWVSRVRRSSRYGSPTGSKRLERPRIAVAIVPPRDEHEGHDADAQGAGS